MIPWIKIRKYPPGKKEFDRIVVISDDEVKKEIKKTPKKVIKPHVKPK